MLDKEPLKKINSELKKGITLLKCRKCGCMKDVLETLLLSLSSIQRKDSSELIQNIKSWLKEIKLREYNCLGCKHCYPAVAMNIFNQVFSKALKAHLPTCDSEVRAHEWPPVPGEYFAFCEGITCPVAVSTLASVTLAQDLAKIKSKGLCIVGKTETENIGIDKIIKNIITNPTIRFLLLVGKDSEGHKSGKTILVLWKNGVDENMRIMGSPGRLPILKNVTPKEIEVFRKQIEVINMIGCEDTNKIINKIDELSKRAISICKNQNFKEKTLIQASTPQKTLAQEAKKNKLDKAGYFVVIPCEEKNIIVEHYSYDNRLLHIIEGKDATAIYSTIIENDWLTELSHAAYLGKELAKAELSLKYGFEYIQDKAF